MKKNGLRKAFHVGSNSSCCQHIRSHFDLYKEQCEEKKLKVHHHAMPPEMVQVQNQAKKQKKLDGMLPTRKVEREFSRERVLEAVAEFIVCDSQVGCRGSQAVKSAYKTRVEPYRRKQNSI